MGGSGKRTNVAGKVRLGPKNTRGIREEKKLRERTKEEAREPLRREGDRENPFKVAQRHCRLSSIHRALHRWRGVSSRAQCN